MDTVLSGFLLERAHIVYSVVVGQRDYRQPKVICGFSQSRRRKSPSDAVVCIWRSTRNRRGIRNP